MRMYPMKIKNQSLNGFTLDTVRFLRADLSKRQALQVLIEAKPHMLDASVISAEIWELLEEKARILYPNKLV
jgi:hypothetical protein|tara:strand:- start:936 stop:1151 length:216 start_codon:yes stop_codon:yes gene_type:complete